METKSIFSSNLTLRYKETETEKAFAIYRGELFVKYNIFFQIMEFVVALIATIYPAFYFEKVQVNKGMFIYYVAALIGTGSQVISLSLSIKHKNPNLHRYMNYLGYLMIVANFGCIRYFLINLLQTDTVLYYGIVTVEYVFRSIFSMVGLISFFESIILCSIHLVYLWVILPLFYTGNPLAVARLCVYDSILFLTVIVSYLSTRELKHSFYLSNELKSTNSWYKNIMDNMDTGFLQIINSKIEYANKSTINKIFKDEGVKRVLNEREEQKEYQEINVNNIFVSNEEEDIRFSLNNIKKNSESIIDQLLKNFDFERYSFGKSINQNKNSNLINIPNHNTSLIDEISSSENSDNMKVKTFFSNFKQDYQRGKYKDNFVLIGMKTSYIVNEEIIQEEKTALIFEVFCRYYTKNGLDQYEFIFNDVTRTKTIEEKNAEFKYKTVFLSKVAHEFKNPLVCISELVEQTLDKIKEDDDNNPFKTKTKQELELKLDNLPMIKSLCNYLIILIKDLDFFSETQTKRTISKLTSMVDIQELIQFCHDITTTLIKKNNKHNSVKFMVDIADNITASLYTDEFKLKQILVNLLSNSVKFINIGEIYLKITEDSNNILKFSIKDTGIGMKKQIKENLFKPYIKGYGQNNKLGTGLGLTIAQELTRLLGSEINFTSEENIGTEFWFYLKNEIDDKTNLKRIKAANLFSSCTTLNLCSGERKTEDIYKSKLNSMANSYNTIDINAVIDEHFLADNNAKELELSVETVKISNLNCNSANSLIRNDSLIQPLTKIINSSQNLSSVISKKSEINVIIVDDEAITRQSAIRMVKNAFKINNIDLNIVQAEDGIEAMYEIYRLNRLGKRVNAVLSDETMIYLNGSQMAKLLKTYFKEVFGDFPFYILTAYEDSNTLNNLKSSGANDVFSKPLSRHAAEMIIENIKKNVCQD